MSRTVLKPRLLVDCACDVGENPLWHPFEKRVYWVDIPRGRLHRHDPATGQNDMFELGAAIGGFTVQSDGALLLFMARGAVMRWQDGRTTPVIDSLPDEHDNRFNDVIADPEGRVFCGTMTAPSHSGRLYRLDRDRTVTQILDGIGTSNGMGFTPDLRQLYYTDTGPRNIYLFDYARATGTLGNQRVFQHIDDGRGRPDGLTVDAEGCVWSARWDGYGLIRYAPDGSELAWFDLPARNVSSLAFGGDDGTDIFITTAGLNNPEANGEHAGALFHMNIGVRGRPEFFSRITVP
jgi:sugar lactone lactonase YvrE